jgi:hypothetical protein
MQRTLHAQQLALVAGAARPCALGGYAWRPMSTEPGFAKATGAVAELTQGTTGINATPRRFRQHPT